VYWTALPRAHYRANVFVGGGPMLASRMSVDLPFTSTIRLQLADEAVGTYFHGGIEGEYLFHPRLSVNARVLGRYAKVKKLFKNADPELKFEDVPFRDREVDFSGFGAFVGLRAYIGY